MKIDDEIVELEKEAIDLRRDFHSHPELGFQEYRTSAIIKCYLKKLGLEVSSCAGTGVVALLKGKWPGKTLMLRADMDALPIQEETGVPFKSENTGVMHACGHDGHIAMLLVAAKVLTQHQMEIKGNIKFVFQPNEEDAGAKIMIDEGILEKPKVDAAMGLHLWSPLPTGVIGIVPGPIMASSYYFKLTIKGRGGHGGAPHKAISPLNPAVEIIQAVRTMQCEQFDILKPTLITIGKIDYGTQSIIIPDTITLEGSIRCLHQGEKDVQRKFEEIIAGICKVYGTVYSLELKCGNTLLNNDEFLTNLVTQTAISMPGVLKVQNNDISVMLGDDFSEFSAEIPAAYYFIGTSNPNKGSNYEHHSSKFNIDENSLLIGIKMHVQTALSYLKN